MSTRTKSFFDSKANDKPRNAQWHRDHNKTPLQEVSVNGPPSKPPIPANPYIKSKLKAFQFVPGEPRGAEAESNKPDNGQKENSEMETGNDEKAKQEKSTHIASLAPPRSQTTQAFPCTPGTRLPIEDLIGNFNEKPDKAPELSELPEEQLGWAPASSSTIHTPHAGKRKRPQSSSPPCANTSSQRPEVSAIEAQTDAEPQDTDPSADLWKRYGASKHIDGDSKLPDFNHLLFAASPRTLETPAKSGLRRWASTGNDWPTSRSKRRRIDVEARSSVPDVPLARPSGKSHFVDMLQKVEESLATQKIARQQSKPAVRIEGPSSSSPLPDTGQTESLKSVPDPSPLQARQQPIMTKATPTAETQVPSGVSRSISAPVQPVSAGIAVSHPNLLNRPATAIAGQEAAGPLCLQSKNRMPPYKRPSIVRTPSDGARTRQVPRDVAVHAPAPAVLPTAEPDDFGDDLELTAEDLEELMSQPVPLDRRSLYQIPEHPNPPPQRDLQQWHQPEEPMQQTTKGGNASEAIQIDDDEDDDDEFGMDDIDEASLVAVELSTTQGSRVLPLKLRVLKSKLKMSQGAPNDCSPVALDGRSRDSFVQRYTVKQVVESEYTNPRGRQCPERVLLAEEHRASRTISITLRDSWTATSVAIGNTVHIAYAPQRTCLPLSTHPPGQIHVTDADSSPLLIVHPDHMLSATTVADSFDCIRKAVLQDRIKATGETSKAMVYGKILHEIFQQALTANAWDDDSLANLVVRTVRNHVEGLWQLGMQDTVLAHEEIKAKMGELTAWARIYIAERPSEVSLVDDKQGEKLWMSISKLIAVEEHVWSPRYGLKGNIDATVQATCMDDPRESAKRLIVPFEVKTGRTTQSPAHRAQTALYTLLLSDRYDVSVTAGILYYLESSTISRIAPPVVEIRQMIQQRNRLAAYLHRARHPSGSDNSQTMTAQTQEIQRSGLPMLLNNPFKCSKCYARQSCFSYHALVENGSATSAGMIDDGKKNYSLVWQEAVGHLRLIAKESTQSDKLKSWFAKWDRLLTFEEGELSRFRKELWTMNSTEREAAGRCFGGLVIVQSFGQDAQAASLTIVDGIEGSGGKINRFEYTFEHPTRVPGHSFTQGTQLTVGEPVVVSSETGQWALANGYIVATSRYNITVAVDRRLGCARERGEDFDDDRNQAFRGIMTVGSESNDGQTNTDSRIRYRLDKDEFSNGLALIRNNLITLTSSHPIHTKVRNLIVLGCQPAFSTESTARQLAPSQIGEMNEDQRAAVTKVLSAKDYALILGMPGTGKTTTIAHIIRALLADEQSILLTSFTHTAVDNILLKIRDITPPNSILRIGVPAKVNPLVQEFCQLAATPRDSIDAVESAYMGSRIVAATCMGINHALFNRRAFDVCIVDEASQITLPTSLGPILHARRFVLVGDHYQLPPLVQNRAALEGGLDVSLFRQLSEEQPVAVATLGKQYRMCEDIMSLSNTLIYNGQLRCGSVEVAQRALTMEALHGLAAFHKSDSGCFGVSDASNCWLQSVIAPERRVVFANTDSAGMTAAETLTVGKNITNQFEATTAAQLVLSLQALGVPNAQIGVISLYRSQLALIRQVFKRAGISHEVEIDSVDRFQGRDKECIILSMVRSNPTGTVGDLLKDWRRINVAFTRARSKLVILGSHRTLQNNDLLSKFLHLARERGWTAQLPADADTCHTFNFSSQAVSSEALAVDASTPVKSEQFEAIIKPISATKPRKSPAGILREPPKASTQRTNMSPARISTMKQPGKVISTRSSQGSRAYKKALEQVAFEIFEDIDADDL